MENFKVVDFAELGEKTTVCTIVTKWGYECTGTYCAKREELEDIDLRREKALEKAKYALEKANERRNQRGY